MTSHAIEPRLSTTAGTPAKTASTAVLLLKVTHTSAPASASSSVPVIGSVYEGLRL